MTVIVVQDKEEVITKLCDLIQKAAKESIDQKGCFSIGFSGGSLASFLVKGLPKISTEFGKWKVYFCDERVVPDDDPDSTFGLYKKCLVQNGVVPLKEHQFIKIKQGVSAEEAAKDYEEKLKQDYPNADLPKLDMLLLGMGPDGHTCSLFPGHKLVSETTKWIASITDSPKPPPCRITMTFPVINNSRYCVFAVGGKEKADMIKRILVEKEDLPAGRVNPTSGELYWIMDKDAGMYVNTIM